MNPLLQGLLQLLGSTLVLAALIDVYLAVLYPRSGKGWLGVRVAKLIWNGFRLLSQRMFWQRSHLLSFGGPTLLVSIVLIWILLLVTGFALILWPGLGPAIRSDDGTTTPDLITALYYSGSVFTTVGAGDIVPKTAFYRMVSLVESAIGFTIFTLTLTYLLAVYSALTQRNIVALSLHHRTASSASSIELLARMGAGEDFNGARDEIATIARDLLNLLESHHAYPVVHYFRFQENYYALPRIAFLTMDTASLIRSVLDAHQYRSLVRSSALAELGNGGQHLLVELSQSFLPDKKPDCKGQPDFVLRDWYYRAIVRLQAEGIATHPDPEAGLLTYMELRRRWEPYVVAIAEYMGYEWHEIAPAESPPINDVRPQRRVSSFRD